SAALNALMHMDEDRAMPVLAQVMERRDECAAPLRRRAVFIIADKGGAEAVDLLLEAARNDPDREVRRQAVFWLSEADDPRAVEALVDMVARSDDEALRERAVFALGQSDSPRARAALRRVAGDTDAPVDLRRRAVFWIGENGGADDVRFIQGLFPTGDAALDERILFAVGEAGGAGSGDWLLRVAADADVDPTLRKRAVFWAAEAGAPADALGALYESTRAPDMKERILFALSESPEDAAMDHLIRIAREEQDHDLRRRAIFWLGNSSDPRAADALMDLLARPRQ
ncbi:MAG TPA: HEAT repeat domain-containing protein, partial [Longimicrobiales bacterium]|nr:HEAT repeat domain-containing protein [Longimicrobiales bacterium]